MAEGQKVKEASIDSKLLYNKLASMQPGDMITYHELSEIIGRDVQREARTFLDTARKMAEREDSLVFGVAFNEGLKCLHDNEIIYTGSNAIDRIRRYSKRTARKFECIKDMKALSNEDRIRMNATASILGIISYMGKSQQYKKIEKAVQETQEQLPYAKTLEAFR